MLTAVTLRDLILYYGGASLVGLQGHVVCGSERELDRSSSDVL